jgi:hypothetical protein
LLRGRYPASSLVWASPTPGQGRPLVMYSLGPSGSGCPFPALPGLPGSSTDLSLRAVPNHPGRSGECLLIASPPISGFIILGRLATSISVTRPNRVHLRYGSQVCFPGFHQPDCSDSLRFRYMHERAIYMVNSFQFTRSARLSLVFLRRKENLSKSPNPCEMRIHLAGLRRSLVRDTNRRFQRFRPGRLQIGNRELPAARVSARTDDPDAATAQYPEGKQSILWAAVGYR